MEMGMESLSSKSQAEINGKGKWTDQKCFWKLHIMR